MRITIIGALLAVASCYSGQRAADGVNRAWEGHARAELEAHWGKPAAVDADGDSALLVYSHRRVRVGLPSVSGYVDVEPGHVEVEAGIRPGRRRVRTTSVVARVDPSGVIRGVRGMSLRWGPPSNANVRWGFLFGAHAGMGGLDDTGTPLPSGGLYIGGMLSRTIGLVGTYSMAAGSDDAGGAMAFAWGLAPQKWVTARLWLRAGPAMMLAFDPGFENVGLEPGVSTAASFAVVRSGSFVLDLRLDLNVGTSTAFGVAGIGVNIN